MDKNKATRIQSAGNSRMVRKIVLTGEAPEEEVFFHAVKRAKSTIQSKIVFREEEKIEETHVGNEEVVEVEEETFWAKKEETKLRKNSVGDLLTKRINLENAVQEREIISPGTARRKPQFAGKENLDKSNKEKGQSAVDLTEKSKQKNIQDESMVKEDKIDTDKLEVEEYREIKIEEPNSEETQNTKIDFVLMKVEKTSRTNSISEILSRRSSIGIVTPRNTILSKNAMPSPREKAARTMKFVENGGQLIAHATSGNIEKVLEMLKETPDLVLHRADDGRNVLHISCSLGHLELVKELVSNYNMDVNLMMKNGLTPLMLSAAQGKVDVTQFLLDFGASYTLQTKSDGYSALHLACIHHQIQSIRSLLEYVKETSSVPTTRGKSKTSKGNPLVDYLEFRSLKGYTAFHLATVEGELAILKLLAEFGANVKATTNKKWSALHFAAHIGRVDICEYLLSIDPSLVNCKNEVSEKPFDIAVFQKHENLLELLAPKKKPRKKKTTTETPVENIDIEKKEEDSLLETLKKKPSILKDMKENVNYLLELTPNCSAELVDGVKQNPKMVEEFLHIGVEVLLYFIDHQPHLLLPTIQSPIGALKKVKTPAQVFKVLTQMEETPIKDDCKEDPELFFLQQLRDNQFFRYHFIQRLRENNSSLLILVKAFVNITAEDVVEPKEEEKNMKTKMTNRLMKSTVSKYLRRLIDEKDVNNKNNLTEEEKKN